MHVHIKSSAKTQALMYRAQNEYFLQIPAPDWDANITSPSGALKIVT